MEKLRTQGHERHGASHVGNVDMVFVTEGLEVLKEARPTCSRQRSYTCS